MKDEVVIWSGKNSEKIIVIKKIYLLLFWYTDIDILTQNVTYILSDYEKW